MQRNDKLAKRLNYIAIFTYVLGGIVGSVYLGFIQLAILIWSLTFVFGSLFKAVSVIISRLDDIWVKLSPITEPTLESTETAK